MNSFTQIARPTEYHLAIVAIHLAKIVFLFYFFTYKHKYWPYIPSHHEKQGIINGSVKSIVLVWL